jgi:mono/diheme cytochrome c family protein
MNRIALLCAMLLGMATFSFSQGNEGSGAKPELTETQKRGKLLLETRCTICHLPTRILAAPMAPWLSKQTVAKGTDIVEKQILDGSPGMPGFRYGLDRSEIAAVIEYIKTVEPREFKKPEAAATRTLNPE